MPNLSHDHVALRWLHVFGRKYATVWETYARVQQGLPDVVRRHLKLPPEGWPRWCYCPTIVANAIVASDVDNNPAALVPSQAYDAAILAMLAAWRPTQGIYRFDETLRQELVDTPIPPKLPIEVLMRMPAWAVYIETPGMHFFDLPLAGFFATLDFTLGGGISLRLVLVGPEGPIDGRPLTALIRPVAISLVPNEGLLEGVVRAQERYFEAVRTHGALHPAAVLQFSGLTQESLTHALGEKAASAGDSEVYRTVAQQVTPLVSLLLYLCADDADVPEPPPRPPTVVLGKKRPIAPAAKKPTLYDAGARVGAAIRLAREQAAQSGEARGGTKRAHVRSAHYHHYWTGPRTGERKLVLRWLSHILVNADDAVAESVIRPVKDEPETPPET